MNSAEFNIRFVPWVKLGKILHPESPARCLSNNELPVDTPGIYILAAKYNGIIMPLYLGKTEFKMGVRYRVNCELYYSQMEAKFKTSGILEASKLLPVDTEYYATYFPCEISSFLEWKILCKYDFPCNSAENGRFRLAEVLTSMLRDSLKACLPDSCSRKPIIKMGRVVERHRRPSVLHSYGRTDR